MEFYFNNGHRMWLGQTTSAKVAKNIVIVRSVRNRSRIDHDE